MKYIFTVKDAAVGDDIKERLKKKLDKLDKFLPAETTAQVRFITVRSENRIEVTIGLPKRTLRAEVADVDMASAVDKLADVLEKQLVKYKSRLRARYRKESAYKEEFNAVSIVGDEIDNEPEKDGALLIERVKRFEIRPMDSEEAVMEMEMLGHSFYVYLNYVTNEVNVVYKRKNGSYGLIEPEFYKR
jgi:putative sigma-54 modulation protein